MGTRTLYGELTPQSVTLAIVASRFNGFIVESLVGGAVDVLRRHGVKEEDIDVIYVPGALEVPLAAKALAKTGRYQAIIALGAVIRGATPHFDIVASESAKGLSSVALEFGLPVVNGILTTNNIEQAIERAGTKAGNKGADAALTALEMVSLLARIAG